LFGNRISIHASSTAFRNWIEVNRHQATCRFAGSFSFDGAQ
jgi:hypothetical protein